MRSLSFTDSIEPQALSLASGSQDATIRLWQITQAASKAQGSERDSADELLDAFEASLDDVGDEGGRQISLKRHTLAVKAPDGRCALSRMLPPAVLNRECTQHCCISCYI